MGYLTVRAESVRRGTPQIKMLHLRDMNDVYGKKLELYQEASSGRVVATYWRNPKGFYRALARIKRLTEGSQLTVQYNGTQLSASQILALTQT